MPYRHYDKSNKTNTLCNIHVRLLYYIVVPGIAAAMNIMQMAVEAIILHGNTGCCGSTYYAHQQASISRHTAAANMLAFVHASEYKRYKA
jgi:Fe-S oxidoreductase